MNNILEYKGFHTRIEYNSESKTLRGKIEGINDFVDFECNNPSDVETEFHNAVDDYLIFCEEIGVEPEKEYKGSFNVRISPDLHKKIALKAFKDNVSLNAEVEIAISRYVADNLSEKEIATQFLKVLNNNSLKAYSASSFNQNTTYYTNNIIGLDFGNRISSNYYRAKEN